MAKKPAADFRDSNTPFHLVAAALRRGDDDAWRELLRRYSVGLIRQAHHQMFSARLRAKVNPDSVLRSVLGQLFVGLRANRYKLASWDALWGLLVKMTYHRVLKWVRHYGAAKRNLDLEVPLQEDDGGGGGPIDRLVAPEPTPEEAAELRETARQWLTRLPEHQRAIAELWLEGCTDDEIHSRVGRTRARVRQVRGDLMEDLMQTLDCPAPASTD